MRLKGLTSVLSFRPAGAGRPVAGASPAPPPDAAIEHMFDPVPVERARPRASSPAGARRSRSVIGPTPWCDGRGAAHPSRRRTAEGRAVTAAPARPRLVELDARDLADRLGEALHVYVAAMGYPPSTARQRRSLWLDHVRRPGWRAVGWLDPAGPLLGHRLRLHRRSRPVVVRGGPPRPARRRHDRVDRRLLRAHRAARATRRPGRRPRRGPAAGPAGRARTAPTCCCRPPSTARGHPGRAWRLYRRLGFRDVLRDHLFTGDARPFAVLGRELRCPARRPRAAARRRPP